MDLLDGTHSISEISEMLGISIASVTRIRRKLLQKGVISKDKSNNYRKIHKNTAKRDAALKKYWDEKKKEKNKWNPNGFYTKEEDHTVVLLKDKYHLHFKDIGEYIGRSERSVGGRYAYIKEHNPSPLSKEELEELHRYCNQKSVLGGEES